MAGTAGVVTKTEVTHGSVKKIVFAWTSGDGDYAGAATTTTTAVYDGQIIGLTTIPGGTTYAPTDNYDITLTDVDGHDVLLGAGLNRDTANTEHVTVTSMAGVAGSKLTFTVAVAGDLNTGVAVVYIR
uniref:Uncharacterized protein n=1 Tax=viral metagenome TaxID=1070528 RepID=A0A6M3XTI1_9ZZZZ